MYFNVNLLLTVLSLHDNYFFYRCDSNTTDVVNPYMSMIIYQNIFIMITHSKL